MLRITPMEKTRTSGSLIFSPRYFFVCFKHQAKRPPVIPKIIPSVIRRTSRNGVRLSLMWTARFSLRIPSREATALAEKDAVNAGSSASYRISPAASTSTAKITAAIGVPNMPAKPAAIPVTRKIPGAFLNGNFLPAK